MLPKRQVKNLMLDTDKTKLDGIDAGTHVNIIEDISISGDAAATVTNKNAILNLYNNL